MTASNRLLALAVLCLQTAVTHRHRHRALLSLGRKRPHCRVAMVYSVPTMMYANYMPTVACKPARAMTGMARALEDAHIPFDMTILNLKSGRNVLLLKLTRFWERRWQFCASVHGVGLGNAIDNQSTDH